MKFSAISFFIVVLCASIAFAEVPQTINYQGHLASSSGSPINNSIEMVFTLYDDAIEGSNLWSETQEVQVNNGIYAVALGAVTPIDPSIINGALWLGVKVGNDAEMSPRQKLNSVPFAMRAETVNDPLLDALKKRLMGDNSYFVDNGNGTVSDPITGLMIQKGQTANINWYAATGTYHATENPSSTSVCGDLELGGFDDWRVPTPFELLKILPLSYWDSSLHPFVTPVTPHPDQNLRFWTNVEHATLPEFAMYVTVAGMKSVPGIVYAGSPMDATKSSVGSYYMVLCVR